MQTARYSRQLQLPGFGLKAQEKLRNSSVLVIGAGGLGVPALQYLAGMGVGIIGIMDGDFIALTNLHRQVLYAEAEIGKPKAEVAAEKLARLNSAINLKAYPTYITPENALKTIENYDLVIDATDNFATRYLINDACVMLKKPFIYGALFRFEGQVSTFNFEDGPTYRCLYPTPPNAHEIPDCNTDGILGVVPGLIGLQQALEAVKIITGIGKNLSGSLLLFDFLTNEQYKVTLKAQPENKTIKTLQPSYQLPVSETAQAIDIAELLNWYQTGKDFLLIDVRKTDEFAREHLLNAVNIPVVKLRLEQPEIKAGIPLVIICQTGKRSAAAAAFFRDLPTDAIVYNVAGGMQAWQEIDENKWVQP